MKNLLIKECSLKDIEEIKYICEKYEWEYCDFPFDFDLYFK